MPAADAPRQQKYGQGRGVRMDLSRKFEEFSSDQLIACVAAGQVGSYTLSPVPFPLPETAEYPRKAGAIFLRK